MSYEELDVRDVKKTRKSHRCVWCGQVIEVGQPATYRTCVYEGDFQAGYFHPECWDASTRTAIAIKEEFEFCPGEWERGKAINKWSGDNFEEGAIK